MIASGWGALRSVKSNSNTLVIESAPHRSLFPRFTAVVHHGGAGDDSCWAARITSHGHLPLPGRPALLGGCGSPRRRRAQPMPVKRLATNRLASAIQTANDDADMRARAAELSERLAQETVRSGLANRSKALWPNRSAAFRSIDKAPLQRLGIVSQRTINPAHGLLDITVSLLRDTNMGRVNARTRIGHRHQPIPVGTVQRKRSLTFESGVSTRSFCAVSSAMSCARTPTRHSSTSWCSARSTIGCSCPASC